MAGLLEEALETLQLEGLAKPLGELGVGKLEDLELLEDSDLTRAGLNLVNVKKLRKALTKNTGSSQDLGQAQSKIQELQHALAESDREWRDFMLREEEYHSTIVSLKDQVELHKRRSEVATARLDKLKAGGGEHVQTLEAELMETVVQLAEVKQALRNKDIELQSAKAEVRSLENSLQAVHNRGSHKINSGLMAALRDTPPYGKAVDAFIAAVGKEESSSDPLVLLPLLRGLLQEVIQREDLRSIHHGKKVRSAFTSFGSKGRGKGEAAGPRGGEGKRRVGEADEPQTRPGLRRWRRALRAVFNEDAAVAMLDDLLARYSTKDFGEACRFLDQSWPDNCRYAQQRTDMNKLCLRMGLAPILTQYGFPEDMKGVQDANAVISALAKDSEEVSRKDSEVQRCILSNFTRLNPPPVNEGENAINRARMESVLRAYGHVNLDQAHQTAGDSDEEMSGEESFQQNSRDQKKEDDMADLDGALPGKAQRIPKLTSRAAQVKALREEFPG